VATIKEASFSRRLRLFLTIQDNSVGEKSKQ